VNADLSRSFGGFVNRVHAEGGLVVQPRMGMSNPRDMRAGLQAAKAARAITVGTITLDSYTRMGDDAKAAAALATGAELNGYPIVAHDVATTRAVLEGVAGLDFPVQVRHGSPVPEHIFAALMSAGLHATEGGPVSYCLPYSRAPLVESVRNWERCCEMLAAVRETGVEPHLESFGGCMLGQLCPPSLLIAMSVLECLFFRQHGLRSVSLSYAQQTNEAQDEEALRVLRLLGDEMLADIDHHIVVYAYMGVYPRTPVGASVLLAEAARLAVRSGASRLIVKTITEAHRIPTIGDNVLALETAAAAALAEQRAPVVGVVEETGIYQEARTLIEAVLDIGPDLGKALAEAYRKGWLDVPYCLHPDNAGRARSYLDGDGRLHWARIGSMPLGDVVRQTGHAELTSAELLTSLSYVERKFDSLSLEDYLAVPVEAAGRAVPEPKGAIQR
jgi:methylaspartate mutase epsilon subunit